MGVPYGTAITIPFLYYLAIKGRKDISWQDLAKSSCFVRRAF
ncbi:hypothetical protein JCM19237_6724 [Photobacterium aphoticum]|uniref:Uncharacterized protein n=1 Tax=Photobacterium aphoticum TaxID=754436 RepID=A0A090QL00_9GAMM|nr:hypothetical protein JCM19237_6724 [Photobacterium aphoticum]